MDWVKPKHRARRVKSTGSTDIPGSGSGTEERPASQWLEQLCEENVALLQSSLPVAGAQQKRKLRDWSVDRYLNAMLWGTGGWEVDKPSHREYLNDLVEAFGGTADSAHAAKIGKWITQQLPKQSYDPYVALTSAGSTSVDIDPSGPRLGVRQSRGALPMGGMGVRSSARVG
jgi:hypothetical protein